MAKTDATMLSIPNSFSGNSRIIITDPENAHIFAIKRDRNTYCPLLAKNALIKSFKLFILILWLEIYAF
ncbi:hypothetical protein [Chryseobacterium gambrini]|uniref:hypothetical protein n=1 Tax=Chryseobacterium gambrini TaxID=373672 RepID=UPI003D0B18E6